VLVFLGVGEAFDEKIPNTSMLVRTDIDGKPVSLLLDCGYSVPPKLWQQEMQPDTLDGIWISHFHADHAFGLPALLVRFLEEQRKKDLCFLGQKGIESFVLKCLDLAYPNFFPRLGFSLRFEEVEPGKPLMAFGFSWSSAVSNHTQRDLALRLEAKGKTLFYSGDGRPTSETRSLAEGVDIIVHEARTCRAKRLALVHIKRDIRRERFEEISKLARSVQEVEVIIPEPGDRIFI